MIQNIALCINTTSSWTRINTLVALASFVGRTVGINDAFRPAGNVRIAKVFWDTLAGGGSVALAAHGVRSAW